MCGVLHRPHILHYKLLTDKAHLFPIQHHVPKHGQPPSQYSSPADYLRNAKWLSNSRSATCLINARQGYKFDAALELSLVAPAEYARRSFAHLHFIVKTSDRQALDLLSASGAFTLTLNQHLMNYICFKRGAPRSEAGSKYVVANGRVWSTHNIDGVQADSEVKSKVFWGEVPISPNTSTGFTIPSTTLHVSSTILAYFNVQAHPS